MLNKLNIRSKITVIIFLIALVAVAAISFFTYNYNLLNNQEKAHTTLSVVADARAEYFSAYFNRIHGAASMIQNADAIKGSNATGNEMGSSFPESDFDAFEAAPEEDSPMGDDAVEDEMNFDAPATGNSIGDFIEQQKTLFGFEQIYITSPSGGIVASTDASKNSGNFSDPDGTTFANGLLKLHFSDVIKDTESNKYFSYAAAPLNTPEGQQLLIIKINLDRAFAILKKYQGLGKTGEVVLARQDPATKKIVLISPLRKEYKNIDFIPGSNAVSVIEKTLEEGPQKQTGVDYSGNETIQITRIIPETNWVVVASMDVAEANGDARSLLTTFVYVSLCLLALTILLSMIITRSIVGPLNSMRNTVGLIAQGILPEKSENHSKDEFGQMGEKVDELVGTLKTNAEFARRIGEGELDTEFKPASDNDILGMSLLNMRTNLIENEKRDNERNWIVRGVAEISEILRLHDSIDALGMDVIKFILEKIGAIQGAFYVVNDENEDDIVIEMRSSFAYGRKKYLKKEFRFAEGLVGQAYAEKDAILRTEIPEDYVSITSGILGDQRPTCILVVPLITNEEVYGILEFAGFKKFDSSQVKFVQELSLILARTIFNIKVNERTRKHLEESQQMSNELQEKQEVLRQNAEEMQATQEELTRSNIQLEEKIEEVNRTQKRMQLLLENASEVITIYEEDHSIRYISPSVETILGYGQKEMIGKSDIDKVHPDYQALFNEIFAKMLQSPDEKVTVQYEYKTKEGNFIWLESTGTNMLANPAIHGFILNSRDITEKRRAEQEQRMRSKMQALSENSLDLITRLENDSISYINPVIQQYTGKNISAFLNKNIRETELDSNILEGWLKIVEEVNATNEKVGAEMIFPSEMGERVMQVNAIPEFDESETLESVLVVSHDITERKAIELEIQTKNKKITESINYAKRIQTAILPNNRVISKALPDSFILYKPKDVVSGDFPWYIQMKDEIFIAAVDCTGHGVPGALLSLIGYFLLNDIVRSRKITEPGIILDLLDEGVTTTLRQDEDATTKDGMDIALCKINVATGAVEYAGAHRPLYVMQKGIMEEVKGNKFPIGGGIFKNQTNFTNTKLKLNKGDSIYFCSDGYPDQFGGPENRKFGPKRTRELIDEVHAKSMAEAAKRFDQEWENWRGDVKQTDDVLLIGIKF